MESYKTIEVDELAWLIDKNRVDAIIDSRPRDIFARGHVSGSRNFSSRQFENFLPNILDFIEGGVENLVIITSEKDDTKEMMFNLLKQNSSCSSVSFANFNVKDWKDVGKVVEYETQAGQPYV